MQYLKKIIRPAYPVKSQITENYSTKTAAKMSKKYSNDGANKNHTHIVKETCVIPGCDGLNCKGLCAERAGTEILGHHTHKQPTGRMAKRISDYDANGNPNPQWFIRNNRRNKIPEQERQQKNNDIKSDSKQQSYIDQHTTKYD